MRRIMEHNLGYCNICMLPIYRFNKSSGKTCSFCEQDKKILNKLKFRRDWVKTIKKIKNKPYEYHCLLGLSGGKDSAYLAHILTREYNLKILAATVDNGFLPPTALKNIKTTIKLLNLDFIFRRNYTELKKVFQNSFCKNNNSSFERKICGPCFLSKIKVLAQIAVKKNIPLIVLGSFSEQTNPHFIYEMPCKNVKKLISSSKVKKIPRVIFPFYAMPTTNNPNFIRKYVKEKRLVKDGNPNATNCYLSKLMGYCDISNLGYYEQFLIVSHLLVKSKKSRLLVFMRLKFAEIAVVLGLVWRKEVFLSIKKLELSKSFMLKDMKLIKFLFYKTYEIADGIFNFLKL